MQTPDFKTVFSVDQSPMEVFDAITNVREWWSEDIEGSTKNLNDVFRYHYKDVHRCTMKLIEVVPGKRVVWSVLENYFKFTHEHSEWTGNTIVFDITEEGGKTLLHFTQIGLVPEYECFKTCSNAWTNYINTSLRNLIATGQGTPNRSESTFNDLLLEQHQNALS